ncbi:VOC family protein [Agilicoccus flavus]|uniref:VOC family protein n=1 Tax=Agilicoccus flavus TaxID=2775968 RepID=UPI0035587ED1
MTNDTEINDTAISLAMVTVDCDDAHAMAQFWSRLLGGEITHDEGDYAMVEAGGVRLGFGRDDNYSRPAWPDHGAKQFHLDLSVQDLDAATDRGSSWARPWRSRSRPRRPESGSSSSTPPVIPSASRSGAEQPPAPGPAVAGSGHGSDLRVLGRRAAGPHRGENP